MALVASVSSSKGGSGKSTTSINLGVALAKLGKDVTVVDTNISTPYLSMYLGAPKVPVTLHHVLRGNASIKEATYRHASGAKIVPGSVNMQDVSDINLESLKDHLPELKSDIIVLDGAPGLDREAQASIKVADQVFIVTTPELPSVAQSLKTVRYSQSCKKPVHGVIMTRVGHDLDMKRADIETILEHPVVGIIPEDVHIKRALVKREPVVHVFPQAPSSVAYQALAAAFVGHPKPQPINEIGGVYKFMRWALGVQE